jgi:hypothetical protein
VLEEERLVAASRRDARSLVALLFTVVAAGAHSGIPADGYTRALVVIIIVVFLVGPRRRLLRR